MLIQHTLRATTLGALLFVASQGFAGAAGAGASWTIAPPPPWVDELPGPGSSPIPASQVPSGIYHLVVDDQVNVGATTTHYQRRAWTPVSSAGVQNASEIKIRFDPSYQRVVIHSVRLLRNGRNVGALKPAEFKIIQAETDLDEKLYTGERVGLLFVKDLRPGDTVDYAYSIEGANPILDGKFVDTFALGFDTPVGIVRYRLLLPTGRAPAIRGLNAPPKPRVTDAGALRSYTWERTGVPAVPGEDEAPDWYDATPLVEVSEFDSWARVASWGRSVFEQQIQPSRALERLARDLRARSAGDDALATGAIRFVQDEIRYLGIEIGPNSHQPHTPEQVLRQRFGDCKDKALLLVALLRHLGFDAAPALVNTELRGHLDGRQPSPLAFDHAIVQARIGGRELWIDATISHQGGRAGDWQPPPYERALVLRPAVARLATIPLPDLGKPSVVVEETYSSQPAGAGRLDVRTRYMGGEADDMRSSLATTPRDEVAKRYLNFYSQADPDLRALSGPAIEDDRESNVVTVSESYALPTLWSDGRRDLFAWIVSERLTEPDTRLRHSPFALAHPIHVRHEIRIHAASAPDLEDCAAVVDHPTFAYRRECALSGGALVLSHAYRSLRDSVEPGEMKSYLESVKRARGTLRYRAWSSASEGSDGRPGGSRYEATGAWLGGAFLVVALTVGIVAGARGLRRWRRRAAFRRQARLEAGDSPATAWSVQCEEDLLARVAARVCACGHRGALTVVERGTASYDLRTLTILSVRCGACERQGDVYALVASAQTGDRSRS